MLIRHQPLWAQARSTARSTLPISNQLQYQNRQISGTRTRTGSGITAHTLINPTPSSLTSHLARFPPSSTAPLVYLLSTNIEGKELGGLIPTLQAIPNSIGTFSHPITTPITPHQNQNVNGGQDQRRNVGGYGQGIGEVTVGEPTLSLLTFEGARTFRTGVTGRPGAEVGRWQRPTLLPWDEDLKGSTEGDLGTQGGWDQVWRAERGVERIPELEGYATAQSFMVLSDGTPNPLLRSLEAMFPSTTRLGLVSAPTPFVTSRPHTLYHGSQTYSSGAVGLAIPGRISPEISYPLKPMTDIIEITSARGNMLLRIDGKNDNPTQRLILALQERGSSLSKEEDFYLSLIDQDGGPERVVKILSGDPSRGALALETEEPLLPGQKFQFMFRNLDVACPSTPINGQITFSALAKYEHPDRDSSPGESRVVDGVLGGSEEGFILQNRICSVPSATVSWKI